MRIKAALTVAPIFVLCAASASGAGDRLEPYDYPGAYAQRFDGVDKGGGADRDTGLSYSNTFTAIPDSVPGSPGAFGSLGTVRSLDHLMSGPRAVQVPGSAIAPAAGVATHRLQTPIRVEPRLEPVTPVKTALPAQPTSDVPTARVAQPSNGSGNLVVRPQGATLAPRGKN